MKRDLKEILKILVMICQSYGLSKKINISGLMIKCEKLSFLIIFLYRTDVPEAREAGY